MKNEKEILAQFEKWNTALQSGNPNNIVKLYADDAILVPTVSNKVRHNHLEIRDYFVHFMKSNPVGKIVESDIRIYGEIAVNSGLYTFFLNQGGKDESLVNARFTYVYHHLNDEWFIIEHHSSKMPEPM
jgi:uncharacterized protein (TIGR02246 family)